MGKTYCLAGVVAEAGRYRVVRPLLATQRDAPVRNVGWLPRFIEGHVRWEVFELMKVEPVAPQPPHTEDLWVQAMRSRRRLADLTERRAILAATTVEPGQSLFGAAPTTTYAAAYLQPGEGTRSLATIVVPASRVGFDVSERAGAVEPDVRVTLPVPGMRERTVPVKDHFLLAAAERAVPALTARAAVLNRLIRAMGESIAVRLGLSRSFQSGVGRGPSSCWLMADGFFSLADPQP